MDARDPTGVLEFLQIRSEDYGNDHDFLCDCDQCMELMAMDWWPDDDEEGEQ